jgi:glycogen operon protein
VEGFTENADILARRRRLRRNFLSCLLLAQGVPLLLAGDEVGNSQSGNNNAYCQDNKIGWVDWSGLGHDGEDMTAFIAELAQLRRRFPQLQGHGWLDGQGPDGTYDVLWLTPDGAEMTEHDWRFPNGHFLSYVLAPMERGQPAVFVVINAAAEAIDFTLPEISEFGAWTRVHDTTSETLGRRAIAAGTRVTAPELSVLVFSGAKPRAGRLWRRSKSPTPPRARPGSAAGRQT